MITGIHLYNDFKSLKSFFGTILIILFFPFDSASQNSPEHNAVLSVERIWDRATHNAFTSLIEFNGKMYCTFRESNGHVSDINGSIRVIASDDSQNWYSVALISELGVDLRDPELSVTPDNRIMLNIAGSIYSEGKLKAMNPKISFSDTQGKNFSKPQNIILDPKIKTGMDWLWRATWHKEKVYGTVYQPSKEKSVQLVISDDGINYKFVTTFDVNGGNETTLRFNSKNEMIAVVRRDKDKNGSIGLSAPPYIKWEWNELETRLGGPDLIVLDDDLILCATREYLPDFTEQTIITKIDSEGKTTKLLTLPSGGDCSYPGLLMKDNILFVSYYSSHEEKTAIYLARISNLKNTFDSFERVQEPFVSYDKNGYVELSCQDKEAVIKFTLDGSIPSALKGQTYKNKHIKVSSTTLLRTIAVKSKFPSSKIASRYVGVDILQEAIPINRKLQSGLNYDHFKGKVKNTFEISDLPEIKSGKIPNMSLSLKSFSENYAFIYTGYIKIPKNGAYTFYLSSNDGSRFYLNDKLAINNDGAHSNREESVKLTLNKGYHNLKVYYYQLGGGSNLKLEWSSSDFKKQEIPDVVLFSDIIKK